MLWLFQSINSFLPFSETGVVFFWAAISGLLSMVVYGRWSPQSKLNELIAELQESQMQLQQFEGNEFAEMWPLLKRNLGLSMKRVGLSLGPSLMAGLPLILFMICIDFDIKSSNAADAYFQTGTVSSLTSDQNITAIEPNEPNQTQIKDDYLGFGPSWMRSWIFVFMFISASSALAYRQIRGFI